MGGSIPSPVGVAVAAFLLWFILTADVFGSRTTAVTTTKSTAAANKKATVSAAAGHKRRATVTSQEVKTEKGATEVTERATDAVSTAKLRWTESLQEAYHYVKMYNVNPWDVVNGLIRGNLNPESAYKALILIRRMKSSKEVLHALWVMHVKPGQLYRVLRGMDVGPQYAYYALKVWWERPDLLANYSRHGADARPASSTPVYVEQLLRKHFSSDETMDNWKSFHRKAYEHLKRVYPTGNLKEIDPELYEKYIKQDKKAMFRILNVNNISLSDSEVVVLSNEPTSSEEESIAKKLGIWEKNITETNMKKQQRLGKKAQRLEKKKQERASKVRGTKDPKVVRGRQKQPRKGKVKEKGENKNKKSRKFMQKKEKAKVKKARKSKRKGRRKRALLDSDGEVYTSLSLSSRLVHAWTNMPHSLQTSEDSTISPPDDSTEFCSAEYNTGRTTNKSSAGE